MKNRYYTPLKEKCKCGNPILNHHLLCDKCWGERAKKKYNKKVLKVCKKSKPKVCPECGAAMDDIPRKLYKKGLLCKKCIEK